MAASPLHIGIVACSAEGAALCYRTICMESAVLLGPHAHLELSLQTHSLARHVDCLSRADLDGLAALMLSSANKLAAADTRRDKAAGPSSDPSCGASVITPHE